MAYFSLVVDEDEELFDTVDEAFDAVRRLARGAEWWLSNDSFVSLAHGLGPDRVCVGEHGDFRRPAQCWVPRAMPSLVPLEAAAYDEADAVLRDAYDRFRLRYLERWPDCGIPDDVFRSAVVAAVLPSLVVPLQLPTCQPVEALASKEIESPARVVSDFLARMV